MSFKNVLGKKKVHINKKRYQENQGSTCLSILSSADIIYRLRDYFNSFTWDENFSLVCPNLNFSSIYIDGIFAWNRHSIFTLFSVIMRGETSSRLKEL